MGNFAENLNLDKRVLLPPLPVQTSNFTEHFASKQKKRKRKRKKGKGKKKKRKEKKEKNLCPEWYRNHNCVVQSIHSNQPEQNTRSQGTFE